MNFCDHHRAVLTGDLDASGLGVFLDDLDDPDVVEHKVGLSYDEGVNIDNFDPYGLSVWQVGVGVHAMFGEAAVIELSLGPDFGCIECPVCYLDVNCPSGCPNHERWIHIVAQRQLNHWRSLTT